MKTDTAFSQQLLAVLKTLMESRKPQKFAVIFAVKVYRFSHKAYAKQVRQVLKASTAVKACAGSVGRAAPVVLTKFHDKAFFPNLFECEHIVAERVEHKEGTREEQFFAVDIDSCGGKASFHGTGDVTSCMQECNPLQDCVGRVEVGLEWLFSS